MSVTQQSALDKRGGYSKLYREAQAQQRDIYGLLIYFSYYFGICKDEVFSSSYNLCIFVYKKVSF